MGIHGARLDATRPIFGGDPNRIHNVELVAHLVDDKLIAPGEEFSFNKTTGERNAAKGFLEAPVIVNGELTTGLGGGVCQVSTTVFNAAFEAGLKITERTNHALYISHYPQGRDATVDYPDVDLKFVNDTGHWLLLRTFVSSVVAHRRASTARRRGRKVVSTTAPLVVHGKPPVKKTIDPTLKPGEKVVDDPGEPAMTTSVTRDVYAADGKLLYHDVWYSSYRAVAGARAHRAEAEEDEAGEDSRLRRRRRDDDDSARRNSVGEPLRHARRPERRRVDARVRGPAVRQQRRRRRGRSRTRSGSARRAASTQRVCTCSDVVEPRRDEVAADTTRARAPRSRGRAAPGSRRRTSRRYSTRATSNQTRYDELCAIALRVGVREPHADASSRT